MMDTVKTRMRQAGLLFLLILPLFVIQQMFTLIPSLSWFSTVMIKDSSQERRPSTTPPKAQQQVRFGCLDLDSSNCACVLDNNSKNESSTALRSSTLHTPSSYDMIKIPPNVTYQTVNRTALVKGMGLTLRWTKNGNEGTLLAWKCGSNQNQPTPLTMSGMSFRVFAQSNDIRVASQVTTPPTDNHNMTMQLAFPQGTPFGVYNITAILVHVDNQGIQDAPCPQGLRLRPHCLGETLWFDNFVNWVVFDNIVFSGSENDRTKQSHQPCTSVDQLSPGFFSKSANSSGHYIWTPAECFVPPLPTTTQTPMQSTNKVLLIGDSTLHYWNVAQQEFYNLNFTHHLGISLTSDLQRLLRTNSLNPTKWPNTFTLILGIGLHPTCYGHPQEEYKLLPSVLQELRDTWIGNSTFHKIVIRSTPAMALQMGRDFNDIKCLYYTAPRLEEWNSMMRKFANELNFTYWDVYSITDSVGPHDEAWKKNDGTHYCKQDSNFCRQLISMTKLAVAN